MPRVRRPRVDNHRRRREQQRNLAYQRWQVNQAPQRNDCPPVRVALNQLAHLYLQHQPANDTLAQAADQSVGAQFDNIPQDLQIQLPPPHHLSDMSNRCPHCAARYFQEECTTQHVFTKCCFQGKVNLPPIQLPSHNIVQLFSGDTANSRHFLDNIRHYNAVMAMASWNATLTEHAGRGPQVVTIHGQAYHLTAAQEAPQGQPPQYAQLYILDTIEAMQQRINDPFNHHLRPEIMQILQDELLAVNPYTQQYHNMGHILQRERQLAAANNQPVQPVKLIIAK